MLVYFSGSARNIEEDIGKYRAISETVRGMGHSLAHDWVETSWLMSQRKGPSAKGWDLKEIAMESEAGIEMAELVIAEASNISTFGVGYELALALQRKKPVLALIDKRVASDTYAAALNHELLTVFLYQNDAELQKAVELFIQRNTVKTKDLRFNFVIDRKIYNHLRIKSFESGKTKAEILRDLLLKDIDT